MGDSGLFVNRTEDFLSKCSRKRPESLSVSKARRHLFARAWATFARPPARCTWRTFGRPLKERDNSPLWHHRCE